MPPEPQPERRVQEDRRRKPTSPLSLYAFRGARRGARRASEAQRGYYVDRYSLRALVAITTILVLCILDGYLTLRLVERGAQEINPVMRFVLPLGAPVFLAVKYAVTGACLVVLLIHKNFYLFRTAISVRHVVLTILGVYVALIAYEVFLLV